MFKKAINLLRLRDRFSKERFSIGLDIGTSTIKLATLKFTKDKAELYDFYLEPIQSDLTQTIRRITQLTDTKAVNSIPMFRYGVNISVSGPSTIIRYVNFPKMNDNELKQALKFEAEKHIPFPIAEVNLDSHILKQDLPDDKILVLLAAAKKEFVNQRLKIIEDAGINVNIVDIDSIALINAFNFNYSQDDDDFKAKTIALINIGASLSNLNILEGRLPCLSRDIHMGGNNFTHRVADVSGIDFKSAEELKLNPDEESSNKVALAIESVLSNLAQEIRASFDYYESQRASSVVKIFLSGGGGLFAGLKDMLVNLLGIEVEYWDPLRVIDISNSIDLQKAGAFRNTKVPEGVNGIRVLSRQLAVAVGLALHK